MSSISSFEEMPVASGHFDRHLLLNLVQALLRAQRPPSLGGPPLQAATSSPFVGGAASASPFQQQPTAFQQSGPFQQQPGSVPQQQPGPSQQTQSSGTGANSLPALTGVQGSLKTQGSSGIANRIPCASNRCAFAK